MANYDKEMLLRARQLTAAKDALEEFMQGPGGVMMAAPALTDLGRALGHLVVRYADAKDLLIDREINREINNES
jgi:hypothetical protein